MGTTDRGAAEWRQIDANHICRPLLLVRQPKVRWQIPAAYGKQVVQLRRRQVLALARGQQRRTALGRRSDILDDGSFTFRKISEGPECTIELTGPQDPQTGIQFLRAIRIDSDSRRIRFRATMKNATGHSIEWSMHAATQY